MMRKSTIIIISIIITNFNLLSQDYFQQDLNYIIDVELNDKKHLLIAEMTIDYTNNSPDNLDILWFHIWPNAYKNNTTALAKQKLSDGDLDFQYATDKERGYISNPIEEKNMKSPSHRNIIAEGIYRAIIRFKNSREKLLAEE